MGKKKKQFIDKKHSVRFHLVHRDQRDPLQADPEASEFVLQPAKKRQDGQKEEQKKHGIYFEDEYDYLQHLKPLGDGVLLMADDTDLPKEADTKEFGGIRFPKGAFASEYEEPEGMLQKGVLPRGPQPDWDPDIVEALDDGLDLDNPENLLEDEFILLANGEGQAQAKLNYPYRQEESDEDEEDEEFGSDDFDFGDGSMDGYENEETKSRFTSYSMTSSVIRRTQGLQLLDDQFEKIMEEYDDDEIGGLDDDDGNDDTANAIGEEKLLVDEAIADFDKKQSKHHLDDQHAAYLLLGVEDDGKQSEEEFERVREPEKEKWDCESIISTYSNIYNHPTLITEPKPIKLTKKLGIPSDVLKKKYQGHKDEEVAHLEENSRLNNLRKKDESKDEKKSRKQAVKEERRNRRIEKKENKAAFKHEQRIQEKIVASQPLTSTVPI